MPSYSDNCLMKFIRSYHKDIGSQMQITITYVNWRSHCMG